MSVCRAFAWLFVASILLAFVVVLLYYWCMSKLTSDVEEIDWNPKCSVCVLPLKVHSGLSYYHGCKKESIMADNRKVSPAEIEKFKIEKEAEFAFLSSLDVSVRELATKVSPTNSVLASMRRFLKARVG